MDHQHSASYEHSGAVCTLAYDYCLLPARYSILRTYRYLGHLGPCQPCLPMEWGALCTDRGRHTRCVRQSRPAAAVARLADSCQCACPCQSMSPIITCSMPLT